MDSTEETVEHYSIAKWSLKKCSCYDSQKKTVQRTNLQNCPFADTCTVHQSKWGYFYLPQVDKSTVPSTENNQIKVDMKALGPFRCLFWMCSVTSQGRSNLKDFLYKARAVQVLWRWKHNMQIITFSRSFYPKRCTKVLYQYELSNWYR